MWPRSWFYNPSVFFSVNRPETRRWFPFQPGRLSFPSQNLHVSFISFLVAFASWFFLIRLGLLFLLGFGLRLLLRCLCGSFSFRACFLFGRFHGLDFLFFGRFFCCRSFRLN